MTGLKTFVLALALSVCTAHCSAADTVGVRMKYEKQFASGKSYGNPLHLRYPRPVVRSDREQVQRSGDRSPSEQAGGDHSGPTGLRTDP